MGLVVGATSATFGEHSICDHGNQPLLLQEAVTTNAWRSFRVSVPDGGIIWASVQDRSVNARVTSLDLRWWDARGARAGGFNVTGGNIGRTQVRLAALDVRAGSVGAGCVSSRPDTDSAALPRGEYVVLAIAAGDAGFQGTFSLWASPGAEIVRSTGGHEAFLYQEADFTGGANAMVILGGPTLHQVHIRNAAVERHVTRSLFGMMGALDPETRIGYDAPTGSRNGQTLYSIDGGPGNYRFRIDADDNDPLVWVIGADAELP